jgi:rhodanese-related sulfurtransferase
LIDVRTDAEFAYVGEPELGDMNNPAHKICWKIFPDMNRNPHFEDAVRDVVSKLETPILFLCRSGIRSATAAATMTALGYQRCYNITEGFEGDKDGNDHCGSINGWKVRGLPWVQK